jgi:hypothetical protein
VPQAKLDFSKSPQAELETYLRRINVLTVAAARALLERYDFSSTKTLADVGCGGAGIALTITNACPHIHVTALDLPQVAPIAQKIRLGRSDKPCPSFGGGCAEWTVTWFI